MERGDSRNEICNKSVQVTAATRRWVSAGQQFTKGVGGGSFAPTEFQEAPL